MSHSVLDEDLAVRADQDIDVIVTGLVRVPGYATVTPLLPALIVSEICPEDLSYFYPVVEIAAAARGARRGRTDPSQWGPCSS